MQKPLSPRIKRGPKPDQTITAGNYRAVALQALRRDFNDRCAYSMQHMDHAGGLKCMEVDHFDPRQKHDIIQDYENLLLASRHCNGNKGTFWPSEEQQKNGIRLINPCLEQDYGLHIFEDPDTSELVGATPTGDFHVSKLDLNANHLVRERRRRARILRAIANVKKLASEHGRSTPQELDEQVTELMEYTIPIIDAPTQNSLGQGVS